MGKGMLRNWQRPGAGRRGGDWDGGMGTGRWGGENGEGGNGEGERGGDNREGEKGQEEGGFHRWI